MKELKEFTVELLEQIIEGKTEAWGNQVISLAKIALAAKQANPVAITDRGEISGLAESGWVGNFMPPDYKGVDEGDEVYLYTTPPLNHAEQHLDMATPDGWKFVPIEPTVEMREAFHESYEDFENCVGECPDSQWKAMLRAAPKPEM